MNAKLNAFNRLKPSEAREEFLKCCGSSEWADLMVKAMPFDSPDGLYGTAGEIWQRLDKSAWLEAFKHHPRIGDIASLRAKFATTANWAEEEQSGALGASDEVLRKLSAGNKAFEAKFGFIFLVCATGKSAAEMLEILERRLQKSTEEEIRTAAGEQAKITRLRLERLLSP